MPGERDQSSEQNSRFTAPGFSQTQRETIESLHARYSTDESFLQTTPEVESDDIPADQAIIVFPQRESKNSAPQLLPRDPDQSVLHSFKQNGRGGAEDLDDTELARAKFVKWRLQRAGSTPNPNHVIFADMNAPITNEYQGAIYEATRLINKDRSIPEEQQSAVEEHPWSRLETTLESLKNRVNMSQKKTRNGVQRTIVNRVEIIHHQEEDELEIIREKKVRRFGTVTTTSESFVWSPNTGLTYEATYLNPETGEVEDTDEGEITKDSLDERGREALRRFDEIVDAIYEPMAA